MMMSTVPGTGGGGRGQPEALGALRRVMALDEFFDPVLVVHGLTDLVTPYFETALLLRQLAPVYR